MHKLTDPFLLRTPIYFAISSLQDTSQHPEILVAAQTHVTRHGRKFLLQEAITGKFSILPYDYHLAIGAFDRYSLLHLCVPSVA